jgi:glycosyltransferase involved in cell wall biosynthesis
MPLARYLSELGLKIDLLCLTGTRSSDHFTIDLSKYDSPDGFVPKSRFKGIINENILEYLGPLNDFNVFLFSKQRRNIYVKYFFQVLTLSRFLNSGNYDIIHFIGQNEIYILLYRLLKPPKVFTFHEVLIRLKQGRNEKFKTVNFISRKRNSVILHSANTKTDYLSKYNPLNKDVDVIKFGLFETYRLFPDQTHEELRTLLYYGIILPYKGLEYLVEAFKIVRNEIKDVKLIIAGRGQIYFDESILIEDGIELINRTITEEELVNLNKRATLVICPYTSASQSGIPVTSFIFDKPIIASNVEGVTEYVIDGYNGILVPPGDSISLASEIKRLLVDIKLKNKIKTNIRKLNDESRSTWISIAEKTIEVYRRELQNCANPNTNLL